MYDRLLTISLWQRLDDIDKWLFVKLNSKLANPFFDVVFPYLRDPFFWAPLYIFVFAFITINYGKKGGLWTLVFLATVAITDLAGT